MKLRSAVRLLAALGLACALFAPRAAHAEDDATTEMARQRFREGVGYYDQRQYEKARLAFLQAYALKAHPSILLNLAQSELRGNRPGDAVTHFTEFLKANTEASESEKQEAELGLAAAKSKVGEVTVNSDTAGAQVTVDGDEKGTIPLPGPLYLAPGAHTVEAKSGDKRASKTVNASAGQATAVNLTLKSAGTMAPVAAPAHKDEAEPEAKEPEEEAAEPSSAPPESDNTASAEVSTGSRKNFIDWWTHTPAAIVATGVGVVGVGLGITFAAMSHQDFANADSYKADILAQWAGGARPDASLFPQGTVPCALPDSAATIFATHNEPGKQREYADACKKFDDTKNSGETKKTVAIVSSIVGGVGLVGTVVYYFVDRGAKESATAKPRTFRADVSPWLGGGVSGLAVSGSF
ncbi:MAG TPA: PEGA domain-containing protein [Polyangiaceae bacterium]|nr:PEGA domain-containing protein [Polyangiaceae bacterium]